MTISRLEGYTIGVTPEILEVLATLFGCNEVDLCSAAAKWHANRELFEARRPFRNVTATQFMKDTVSERRSKGIK